MRQDMEDFLEKFDRQSEECGREPDVDRGEKPAGGVHEAFEKDFHGREERVAVRWRLEKRAVVDANV
ncbi:hypothetical protein SUTMEG_07080 [Sutterella megalosphaeroides]|uniref:Uncharacterized protein n=1 Tax=Sutterella megalosphaeroides TaxID=2494234 RepID=A0A2Z6IB38_9BURK|nr:hypothetical protein SUTMEG_07080 [Sutterella megalosphaeroides]